MLPLEGTLLEKLRKIEALHAGTNVDGEREAARRAAERIRARLAELRGRDEDIELLYRLPDPWKRKLFVALCRRYGLTPFRESGRRYSTVQLRAPKEFLPDVNYKLPLTTVIFPHRPRSQTACPSSSLSAL